MLRRFEIRSKTSENTKLDQQHSENHAAKLARLRAEHRLEVPDQSKHEPSMFEQQRRKQQEELKGVAIVDYRHTDTPRLRGGTPTDQELVQDIMGPQQYQYCINFWAKKRRRVRLSKKERDAYRLYNKFKRRADILRERNMNVTKENILDDNLYMTSYKDKTKYDIIYSFLSCKKDEKMDEKSKSDYKLLCENYNKARAWAVEEHEKEGFPNLDEEESIVEYTKIYLQAEVIEAEQDIKASLAQLRAEHRLEVPDQSKYEPSMFEQQRRKQQEELKDVETVEYIHTDKKRLRGGKSTDLEVIPDIMGPQQYLDSRIHRNKSHRGEKISEKEREAINVYNKFVKRASSLRKRGINITRDNMLGDALHKKYKDKTKHDVIYSFLEKKTFGKMDKKSRSEYFALDKSYDKARKWAVKKYKKHGYPGLDEEEAIVDYTKFYLLKKILEPRRDGEAASSR